MAGGPLLHETRYRDAFWNERDALAKLHAELLRRGWITKDARWTVAEILI